MSQNKTPNNSKIESADENAHITERSLVTSAHGSFQFESTVIAVMGVSGSGKSTFISLLADQTVRTSDGLESDTANITPYSFKDRNGRTIFLIEFPGFDDTSRPDADILKDVACFFTTMYAKGCRLGGLIYLHRITDSRMGGNALKNLTLFKKLCGRRALHAVRLVTTMWDQLGATDQEQSTGWRRHEELQQRSQFWGSMIKDGAECLAHDGSAQSARDIVSTVADKNHDVTLRICDEMVNQNLSLDRTVAGQFVMRDLLEAQRRFEREVAEYLESLNEAREAHDSQLVDAITRGQERAEETAVQLGRDQRGLSLSVDQLSSERRPHFQTLSQYAGSRHGRVSPGEGAMARGGEMLQLENPPRQQETETKLTRMDWQMQRQTRNIAHLQMLRKNMAEEHRRFMKGSEKEEEQARRQRSHAEQEASSDPVVAFFGFLFGSYQVLTTVRRCT